MPQNSNVLLTFDKVHNPLRVPAKQLRWSEHVVSYFEMCFAPQRHALFRHINFQKRPDTDVFLYILT